MPQPTPYTRQHNFTDFQAANPSVPLPGYQVDAELNGIEQTLGEAIANLALIQRDDGKLRDGVVTVEAVSLELREAIAAAVVAPDVLLEIDDDIADDAPEASIFVRSAAKVGQLIANAVASVARVAVNREALASTAMTSIPVYLMEGRRRGWFAAEDYAPIAALVDADTTENILYRRSTADPTKAWARAEFDGWLRPEWAGAPADGVASDQPAFDAINTLTAQLGYAHIEGARGATYRIGFQTDGGANYKGIGSAINALNLKSLIVNMNGATIKYNGGMKYGRFDPVTGDPLPDSSTEAPANERAHIGQLINAENVGIVVIRDGTLDGNSVEQIIGGEPGPSGHQQRHAGIWLPGCKSVHVSNVVGFNFLLDAWGYHQAGMAVGDPARPFTMSNCVFHSVGRNVGTITGGNAITLSNVHLKHNAAPIAGGGTLTSGPNAALDVEGAPIRNVRLIGCTLEAGIGGELAFLNLSGDTENVLLEGCVFVGKNSLVQKRTRARNCRFYGTFVQLYGDNDPSLAVQFDDCLITDATLGDTPATSGNTYVLGNDVRTAPIGLRRCRINATRLRVNLRQANTEDCEVAISFGTEAVADNGAAVLLGAGEHRRLKFFDNITANIPATGYFVDTFSGPPVMTNCSSTVGGKVRIGVSMAAGVTGPFDNVTGIPGATVDTATSGGVTLRAGPMKQGYVVDAALTAARSIDLPAAGVAGRKFRMTRTANAAGAFNLNVRNSALVILKTLAVASTWADFEDDGTAWRLVASGGSGADLADGTVTYAKLQNVSATDRLLGRSTAGAGVVQEITCTAAGRALLDDADAAGQRGTLGLGTAATANKAAASSATYVAPAGGATVDVEARASLAQLAADFADLKAKLAAATLQA